ncbi:Uncharacterised protein (plasmid) [Tsukamurella tyrosinosolvens]|uniref:Uncharacterized protein n=1 Tax=Tsukamurella tyrosinosolvens TaxID=57704 RepID=A0A1H4LS90_TSUTY|nr:hypothetical protein [Tsukamurella tyrosinosolvens]KXO96692.1 hypothetical protein AXK58_05210 [Tsukamurella tyrosinosolvens]SEB73072.1 hypothetical protein SAMN04489793_0664 [Tsukamurella tyrosinosolvens]VEH93660.1 Uncharacterised protein [Tsukamurella tyrosinosolvens]
MVQTVEAVEQRIADVVFDQVEAGRRGWSDVELVYMASVTGGVGSLVLRVDGGADHGHTVAEVAPLFEQLRTAMASPGRPVWFSARMLMDEDGEYAFTFAAPPVWSRPSSVTAAAVILLVLSGLVLLGFLASNSNPNRPPATSSAEVAAALTVAAIVWSAVILGVVAGIRLLRGRGGRVVATVAACIFGLTCVGLVATIAVPLLLWRNDESRGWFDRAPRYLPPSR